MSVIDQGAQLDEGKLQDFVFRVVGEIGATLNTALVVMGDKLGLYQSMAGAGPMTPGELAERTGTAERYLREWLNAQAAGDFVGYDPDTGRYTLPPEQAVALTDADSPAFLPGFFQIALGSILDSPKIMNAARSGAGFGWGEHGSDVLEGCERFSRPGYNANLMSQWLPALDGVVGSLERGALVADVGCGHGSSTILMAQAFPKSTFVGTDYHGGSIETARQRAKDAGVDGRVSFETAPASAYSGAGYDLVTMFDCLHDMGDPVGAARHVRGTLKPEGTWMIVEPNAADRVEGTSTRSGGLTIRSPRCCARPPRCRRRSGWRLYYEVYGSGEQTVLLLPTWSVIHSRHWKMQIPYLARHCRVVTFDGRGNGRSDRPAAGYGESEFAADALAVMDATGTARATLVPLSQGAQYALILAAEHPDRVTGAVFVGPGVWLAPMPAERTRYPWDDVLDTDEGWAKDNRHYWLRDYRGFLEFFFAQMFPEPHSTKAIEDCVGWGLETTAETLIATALAGTCGTRSRSTSCCGTSCARQHHRRGGCGGGRGASARCTSPRRSAWVTPSGTWRSRMSRAGRYMDYDNASPEQIATAIAADIGRPTDYRPVAPDSAARAAAMLAELL